MSITALARDEIRALSPYKAAEQVDDTIRLNANEAPFRNPAEQFRRPLNRYPEIRPVHLRRRLAGRYGVRETQLLVSRGSSEAIDMLIRVFCRAGRDNVVTTSPSFSMYRHYATIQGADCRAVPADPDAGFAVDAAALLAACDEATRLIFLCSPNNPTGTLVDRSTLVDVLTARRDRSVVVIDEAYVEFSESQSAIGLLDEFDNLIVLRTLSKALALAGARCGAVIGHPDAIAMLDAVQAPYALATPVVEMVERALTDAHWAEAARQVALVRAERERVQAALANLPFVTRTWRSDANFVLVEVDDVDRVLAQTRRDGILVRHFADDLADCLRISIGAPAENENLLRSLEQIGKA